MESKLKSDLELEAQAFKSTMELDLEQERQAFELEVFDKIVSLNKNGQYDELFAINEQTGKQIPLGIAPFFRLLDDWTVIVNDIKRRNAFANRIEAEEYINSIMEQCSALDRQRYAR